MNIESLVGALAMLTLGLGALAILLWRRAEANQQKLRTLETHVHSLTAAAARGAEAETRLRASEAEARQFLAALEAEKVRASGADALAAELDAARRQAQALAGELRDLRARSEEQARAAERERQAMLDLKRQVEEQFQTLATQALRASEQQFLTLAGETFLRHREAADQGLKGAIDPVKTVLEEFRKKIEEVEQARAADKSAIAEQVRAVGETLAETRNAALKLAHALKASPQVRGRWGEEQLRNVLELAGLSKFADFDEQSAQAGGALRPDVIVRLPGGRKIVIDAKVALDAYLDAVDAVDEATREGHLQRHARHVRDHMQKLASKDYWRAVGDSVDFVALFIPGENFFAAAVERDHSLLTDGYGRRVLVTSGVTLVALLKAVAYGWCQEQAAEHAQSILKLGTELYERLATMGERLDKVGRALTSSVSAYNDLVGSVERGLLPGARKLRDVPALAPSKSFEPPEAITLDARPVLAKELMGSADPETQRTS